MSVSSSDAYLIDRMNSTALKTALGTAILNNTPSHVLKYAGTATTAGGAAAEAITVSGVASTDLVMVMPKAQGVTPRTILKAVPTTNTITVTFSGDPSTDHVVYYFVYRVTP